MAKQKKIKIFCCENSASIAAETLNACSVPSSVELIHVPCSGKVKITRILDCIHEGADKIVVLACPVDSCTYITGNKRALKRVNRARGILEDAGLDKERVRIEFISSLDTHKLIRILKE